MNGAAIINPAQARQILIQDLANFIQLRQGLAGGHAADLPSDTNKHKENIAALDELIASTIAKLKPNN